jgi:hypothetical protein
LVIDEFGIVVLDYQAYLSVFVDLAVRWVDQVKLLVVLADEEAPSLTVDSLVDLTTVHVHDVLDGQVAFVAVLDQCYRLVVARHGGVGLGA